MDEGLKYLFVSFVLDLTDEQEDARVVELVKKNPNILSTLFKLENKVYACSNQMPYKDRGRNRFRAKLKKYHIL